VNAKALIAAAAAVLVAACGDQAQQAQRAQAEQEHIEQLAQTCPQGSRLAGLVDVDLSGTGRDTTLFAARKTVIEDEVRRVATCSGHLRVTAFSSSAAATKTVFNGELHPDGATEIARHRRVPDLVTNTMSLVNDGLGKAGAELPSDGSDIMAVFGLAQEHIDQLNAGRDEFQLDLQVLTDGVQTTGVLLNTPGLTSAVAIDLATRLPAAPSFPSGTVVTISGLGKVAGPPPPTSYVDALKSFYSTFCHRTTPTCSAVTEYASGG
jgi:hypothetical protein